MKNNWLAIVATGAILAMSGSAAVAQDSRQQGGQNRAGNTQFDDGNGRVAPPFGFALTDPYVRLSRIRLFPKVTPKPALRGAGMSDPRCWKGKTLQQRDEASPS